MKRLRQTDGNEEEEEERIQTWRGGWKRGGGRTKEVAEGGRVNIHESMVA